MNVQELYDKAKAARALEQSIHLMAFVADDGDEVNAETLLHDQDVIIRDGVVTIYTGIFP